MKENYLLLLFGMSLTSVSNISIASDSTLIYAESIPEACIITRDTSDKYCLKAGEIAYTLPKYIMGDEVDLLVPSGLEVVLSDYGSIPNNHTASFDRYTENKQLEHVKARNGKYLDFSTPYSMLVVPTKKVPEACIVSRKSGEKFCLTAGELSYTLPAYIKGDEVDLQIPSGLVMVLSDDGSIPNNHTASFDRYTENKQLEHVKARNGKYLDFSAPYSMLVVPSKRLPEACIISRITNEKYCLTAGQRSGYALPHYIRGHEVDLIVPDGLKVILSDFDNLSYNRLGFFTKDTDNADLINVLAFNGEYLDFSEPHSMRVSEITGPVDPVEPPVQSIVGDIMGSVGGNDAYFNIHLETPTISERVLGLQFSNSFESIVKIDFSSLVYASFDGGKTWPKVVDINTNGSLVVPIGSQSILLRVLTLIDDNDNDTKIELFAWLDEMQADKKNFILDISGSYSENNVKLKEMLTDKQTIMEGEFNTSHVMFDRATYRNTGLGIQLLTNSAQVWIDLRADVELIYTDASRTYQYDVNLLNFKVLNIPAGVSEVIITYYSVDDNIKESDEVFNFKAWIANHLDDSIVAETVIVDND